MSSDVDTSILRAARAAGNPYVANVPNRPVAGGAR